MLMQEALTKPALYENGPQSGWPEGTNDLEAGRIEAIEAACIDMQIDPFASCPGRRDG